MHPVQRIAESGALRRLVSEVAPSATAKDDLAQYVALWMLEHPDKTAAADRAGKLEAYAAQIIRKQVRSDRSDYAKSYRRPKNVIENINPDA